MTIPAIAEPVLDPLPAAEGARQPAQAHRHVPGRPPGDHAEARRARQRWCSATSSRPTCSASTSSTAMRTSTACRSVTTATPTRASSRSWRRSASTAFTSRSGITPTELQELSAFLWELKDATGGPPMAHQLAARGIRHVSLARLVALDTRWRAEQWADAPKDVYDPGLRRIARPDAADLRAGAGGSRAQARHHPAHRRAADSEGRRQQRGAGADSGRKALREPDLLPLRQRRHAQPADRQAGRLRRADDRGHRRSRAAARHRQDADPARGHPQAWARSTSASVR